MDLIASDADGVTIRLSETEARIAVGSLSEAHGIRIAEWDFEDRLGGSREDVEQLNALIRGGTDLGLVPGMRSDQVLGPEVTTVRLGPSELTLLRNAMVELTKGEEVEEWEYSTLLGAEVAEGKQLLGEVEALIKASGA